MVSLHKQALEDCFQLQTCSRRLNLRGPVGCDFKLFFFYLHNSRLNIEDDLGTTVFQPKTFFAINYLAFFPSFTLETWRLWVGFFFLLFLFLRFISGSLYQHQLPIC